MPETDKEKAEKVAAAKKKYEQLKKQRAKKATKDGKSTKAETSESAEPSTTADESKESTATAEEPTADDGANEDEPTNETPAAEPAETSSPPVVEGNDATRPQHNRQPSLSLASQMRSESFKRGATSPQPLSGKSPPSTPFWQDGDSVQDVYQKQKVRIEELERENKKLQGENSEKVRALARVEEEAEELRDSRGEMVELRGKAAKADESTGELDKLRAEIQSLQRQNSHLQSQAKDRRRSSMAITPTQSHHEDLTAQLTAKTSTIESLELEVSNLRHSLSTAQIENTDLSSRIKTLEDNLGAAEARAAAQQPPAPTDADADPQARIAELSTSLSTSQKAASDSAARAAQLEKKVEALTSVHKESEARHQDQASRRAEELNRLRTESAELRRKLAGVSGENARLRAHSIPAGGEGDEDDSSEGRLRRHIGELEAEITDLKRGIWRDRRRELQGNEGEEDAGFDDVDLDSPFGAARGARRPSASSPFSAVNNVWNALTGGGGGGGAAAVAQRPRGGSMRKHSYNETTIDGDDGFGDEDEFDEDAFKAAQEEEAMKRIERVRDVKRGLSEWKGWRLDIADLRGGHIAGVFDV